MSKLYSGKGVVFYVILFVIFRMIFGSIEPKYLKPACLSDPKRNYPIDVRVQQAYKFFDAQFVRDEGLNCYDVSGYFTSFFPLDMLFPIVYTLLTLSVVNLTRPDPRLRKILIIAILLGAAFDYLEDFSFALYLTTHVDFLAVATAFFTSLKSILFPLNLLAALLLFWKWTIRMANMK